MEEVVTPELDTYNLAVLYASATSATQVTTVATTKTNAYETFLALQEKLDNNKVPVKGRIAFVNAAYHNQLKQDDSFVKASDIAMKALINGQVGEVDGVKIVKVPASYLPANVNIILTHPSANVNPMQLEELNSHDNPPGISGALIEGRFIYDAFTFEQKEVACAANKIA
jgi:N4-gp56 family major capsid protein